jgi:thermitase
MHTFRVCVNAGSYPIALLLLLCAAAAPARAQEIHAYLLGEVLVKLVDASSLPEVAAAHGLDPIPLDQFGARPIYRLRIVDGAAPHDKAAQLAADEQIVYAEPNYLEQTPEGNKKSPWAIGGSTDAYHGDWATEAIRLDAAHTVTRGAGITVAVLDTGVDYGHPALSGKIRPGFDFVDFDPDPREEGSPANSGYGHGTHVAGLVALAAPEAQILPLRVLDAEGKGNLWVLAEALLYAIDPDNDPTTNDGAQVINLSLGTFRPTNLLAEIVGEVTCAGYEHEDDDDGNGNDDDDDQDTSHRCSRTGGAVVVAAAGNEGSDAPFYPAAEKVAGALAVAASTQTNQLASFSSRGPWVDLAAPGEQIISSIPGGSYAFWSGTSMAAPLTAGTAALVRAANPQLNAPDVAAHLVATGQQLCDGVPPLVDAAATVGFPADQPNQCELAQP